MCVFRARKGAPDMQLRIATWNLDHASKNKSKNVVDEQIDLINKFEPSIIVLTETCPSVDLSGYKYKVHASAPNSYSKNYSAIWTKLPFDIIDTCDPVTSTCIKAKFPFGDLIVYGTILTYKMDKGPEETSRPWEEHHKEIVKQGGDWYRIQSENPGASFVVAGDFNQSRDGAPWYRSLEGISLLDEQLKRNNLISLTDEDFGANSKIHPDPKKGYYRHNIDHICVTKNRFSVVNVGAWDHFTDSQYLSDHNGVFVDLEC